MYKNICLRTTATSFRDWKTYYTLSIFGRYTTNIPIYDVLCFVIFFLKVVNQTPTLHSSHSKPNNLNDAITVSDNLPISFYQ